MASNVKFKDYLNQQLQDPEFQKEFENWALELWALVN